MKKTTDSPVRPGKQKPTQTGQSKKTTISSSAKSNPGSGPYTTETAKSVQQRQPVSKPPVPGTTQNAYGLRALLEGQLQDIYGAEKAFKQALPRFIGQAKSKELVKALNQQLNVTERQVERCENVLNKLQIKPAGHRSEAMEGLLRDADLLIDSTASGVARDAGIICATQKVDHYKIATYGTLTSYANHLGEKEAALWLRETLNEEKDSDRMLTRVAEQNIFDKAAAKQEI